MSEFLVGLLGERLVNSEKAEVDVQSLGAKLSLVGLFFGCSLNAPCKQFNGSLCEFYSRFKKTSEHKDKLEIVFISSDQDQKHWQDFLQEMPWPALPFKDRHKKVRWAVEMVTFSGIRGWKPLEEPGRPFCSVLYHTGVFMPQSGSLNVFPISLSCLELDSLN
ncbi:hypothetical protein LDENG_00091720 [Lucifuga dentata]|nr:hypothetical protein LDENG_00091720 [Lucifuga dentata]